MHETTKTDEDLVTRFLKIYANLPIEERKQVIVVIDKEPISWDVARNEIIHDTERGNVMLDKLKELEVI